ncbi:MAG: single-stranded DNA-binding protein [Sphingopyxis sp.]
MQVVTISGNVGKDAELRTTRDGQKVCSFNVGVKNGFGRDAGSVWYRCSLWGKAAEAFAPSLLKGAKVFVTGDLTHGEYEGKPQYEVRVGSIDTGPRPSGDSSHRNQNGAGARDELDQRPFDDDADSVPF